MERRPTLGFIGAGTVGTALAQCLAAAGYQVVAVFTRSQTSMERFLQQVPEVRVCPEAQDVADTADLVFITTPDDVIAQVARANRWRSGQMVVHCSGGESTDVLGPALEAGALVAVFHPLQSFASPEQAVKNLPGSTFALEGSDRVIEVLQQMAKALGGWIIHLEPGQKVLYHAAAVMVSNYVVTLTDMATRLWEELGVAKQEALAALLPLMRGTLNNLEEVGLPHCLTGPIARGDVNTVRKHLNALALQAPALLPAYRALALQTIPVAEAKGKLSTHKAEALHRILEESLLQLSKAAVP